MATNEANPRPDRHNPKGADARGLNAIAADLNAKVVDDNVEATRRRIRLSDANRQYLLALSRRKDDGSRLLDEVEHLRMMAYYDGKQDALTAACDVVRGKIDDAVRPLVSLGQGDYRVEVRVCPKCRNTLTYEHARPAEPDTNVGAVEAGWYCTGCEHGETLGGGA